MCKCSVEHSCSSSSFGVKVAFGNRRMTGGCATMSEKSEKVESTGTYVTEWVSRRHFCSALCSFGPPFRALVVIIWSGNDAVTWCGWDKLWKGRNYWKSMLRSQSIWAKGCILMSVCVISDLTWLPLLGGGRKSCDIIIIIIFNLLRILCRIGKFVNISRRCLVSFSVYWYCTYFMHCLTCIFEILLWPIFTNDFGIFEKIGEYLPN